MNKNNPKFHWILMKLQQFEDLLQLYIDLTNNQRENTELTVYSTEINYKHDLTKFSIPTSYSNQL